MSILPDHLYECGVCHTLVDSNVNEVCPKCHNPRGSVRCYKCDAIINENVNFCPNCGDDKRWENFRCPKCDTWFQALRNPPGSQICLTLTCPNCGHSFPSRDPQILY